MSSHVERTWEAFGLPCAVLLVELGYGPGHRCGYVCVPEDHPWHGIGYSESAPTEPIDNTGFKIDEDVGVVAGFVYAMSEDKERAERDRRPEYQISVHGGLTFAGKGLRGMDDDGWWFGFDCAHAGDETAGWTHERVSSETERLAEQLAAVAKQPVVAE